MGNFVETYSVTQHVLVFSGTCQAERYITSAKFKVQNKLAVVVTETARMVLEKIEEGS